MFKNITEKVLYKYRWATPIDQVKELISTGKLWFSSAKSFNDPFDTAITYNYDGVNSPIAERWAHNAVNRYMPELSLLERDQYVANRLHQIRTDPNDILANRQEAIEHNYKSFGICSLAKKNDSLLMWGHYANKHRGLCIGLNVDVIWKVTNELVHRKLVIDLAKVNYSKSIPKINFFEAMLDDKDNKHVMQFVGTKYADCSYENEYRLVCFESPNTLISFGPEIVSEIVFGCRMQEEERNSILDFSRSNYPSVRLYEAKPDENLFRLNVVAI
jgi:Protein of unknown function (DUF2971).